MNSDMLLPQLHVTDGKRTRHAIESQCINHLWIQVHQECTNCQMAIAWGRASKGGAVKTIRQDCLRMFDRSGIEAVKWDTYSFKRELRRYAVWKEQIEAAEKLTSNRQTKQIVSVHISLQAKLHDRWTSIMYGNIVTIHKSHTHSKACSPVKAAAAVVVTCTEHLFSMWCCFLCRLNLANCKSFG